MLLSLTSLLYRASRPYVAVLGRLSGEGNTSGDVYGDIERHPKSEPIPGLLILRLDAPLYFFNANVARSQILELIRGDPRPAAVLLDIGATTDFDVTTTDMVRDLATELREESIELLLAQAKGPVRDRMRRTGLMALVGEDRVYLSASGRDRSARRIPKPLNGSAATPAARSNRAAGHHVMGTLAVRSERDCRR